MYHQIWYFDLLLRSFLCLNFLSELILETYFDESLVLYVSLWTILDMYYCLSGKLATREEREIKLSMSFHNWHWDRNTRPSSAIQWQFASSKLLLKNVILLLSNNKSSLFLTEKGILHGVHQHHAPHLFLFLLHIPLSTRSQNGT